MGAVGGVDAVSFGLVGLNPAISAELGAVRCLTRPSPSRTLTPAAQGAPDKETTMTTANITGYQVRTSNGYVRPVRDREEAVLIQMENSRYRAVAIYSDGSESTVY